MRTRTLIKCFTWTNAERDDVVLGPDTRLKAQTDRAQLLADADGNYPTTPDLFVKSRLTTPRRLRRWVGFEAVVLQKTLDDGTGTVVTSTRFRLDDGTVEWYWDGADWVAAGATDWNTQAEMATNISSFDASARSLRVVVNLATSDKSVTPELIRVKLAYEVVLDSFLEDVITRGLVRQLRAGIRPISRVTLAMPATGTTLSLSDLQGRIEQGYNIVDIDAVFDFDAQPDESHDGVATDLLDSYDSGTETITLNTSVTAGTRLFVRFIYAPVIIVQWTSQDFIDADKLPSVVIRDIDLENASEFPTGRQSVADYTTGTAIVLPSPVVGDLTFTLRCLTGTIVDHQRLQDAIIQFFQDNKFVSSTGIDEVYRLQLVDEFADFGEPGQNEIYLSQHNAQLPKFSQWFKAAEQGFVVSNVDMSLAGSSPATDATGGETVFQAKR